MDVGHMGKGDGRWVIELSLACLTFLRDNAPLPTFAYVALQAGSAMSILFATVWRLEGHTSAFHF